MNSVNMTVRINVSEAADLIEEQIVDGNLSGEMIDKYVARNINDQMVMVLVFEKYYLRNSSRASLTVTLENFSGVTKVHAIGSGGGQSGLFKFDWGAGDNFSEQVEEALGAYTV